MSKPQGFNGCLGLRVVDWNGDDLLALVAVDKDERVCLFRRDWLEKREHAYEIG